MFLHKAHVIIKTKTFYIRLVSSTGNYSYIEICDDNTFEIQLKYTEGIHGSKFEQLSEGELDIIERSIVRFIEGQLSYPGLIHILTLILKLNPQSALFKHEIW